jgi:DNA-binding MarR family transcriptional regulator
MSVPVPALNSAVQRYLRETLGVPAPELRPWGRAKELPYFLRDAFQFFELELVGHRVLLAIDRGAEKPTLGEVRTRLDKVRALAGQPVVYVTRALASYERRRLIEHKIPFLVPGNQLYLPDLGIDLREYFRQRSPTAEAALSPSAQAMLIVALLRQPWKAEWQPFDVAVALGYTPMTVSRATRELVAAGIATPYTVGRSRWLRIERPPRETWEHARPRLRSPVKRIVWVHPEPGVVEPPKRLAGVSALARASMLAEPQWPVHASSLAEWTALTRAGVREIPELVPGAAEWQLWSYSPALLPEAVTVDPLSLILSLQDDPDERIQLALDELKGQLPW